MGRTTEVKGFSLTAEAIDALEQLKARAGGGSASKLVNDLILREAKGGAKTPEVLIDGRRFVPARPRR